MTGKLLLDESPVLVLPSLAKAVGLNEAIVLQQVHYWLVIAEKSKDARKFIEGRWWTFGTYAEWQENFPWWSVNTVGRIFRALEVEGLLLTLRRTASEWDQTKWYTIEYTNLVRSSMPSWYDGGSQDGMLLNRNTETTPEIPSENKAEKTPPPLPRTALEASQHPDIMLFRKVCGVFPGLSDYREIIDAATLLRRAHPDETELESYLLPFWLRWQGMKRKDGKAVNLTNPTWFVEWAVNNYTPSPAGEKVPVPANSSKAALANVRAKLQQGNL
jgi:hypothetical protein